MRFRIKQYSHPGPELGQILNELAGNTREALATFADDPEERIHRLRTNMKKMRSLLRLAKAELPAGPIAEIQNDVSRIKIAYASARDQRVLAKLYDYLIRSDEVPELRRLFDPAPVEIPSVELLDAADRLIRRVEELPFWAVTATGVKRALKKSIRQARAAGRRCKLKSADKKFHNWRKRIKALSIQALVLDSKLAKPAGRLAEDLGRVNDLANLRRYLALENFPEVLCDRIERKLAEARQKALHRARKIY